MLKEHKTYEELYGQDKSLSIRQKIAEGIKRAWNKKQVRTNSFKGTTWNTKYGIERANEMRRKLADKKRGGKHTVQAIEKLRNDKLGKTYEEIYGPEMAKYLRQKRSEQMRGLGNNAKRLDVRNKISEVKSKMVIRGCNLNRSRQGYREDLKQFYRSTWEANVARLFNLFSIDYDYEPKVFKLICDDGHISYYRPDFYLRDFQVYIEIKGYFPDKAKKKIALFKNQYPDINLYILNESVYNRLYLIFSHKIENWESSSRDPVETDTLCSHKNEMMIQSELSSDTKRLTEMVNPLDVILKSNQENILVVTD